MKRSELKRGKLLKQGSTPMKRSAMARGTAPMKRQAKPMRARSRTNADPRPATGEAQLCRGQPCYLLLPGVHAHPIDTVVPAHSNQARHGKGRGIKAHDEFTVPGCLYCHAEIDSGKRFTRAEKFALWDDAYERWRVVRDELMRTI